MTGGERAAGGGEPARRYFCETAWTGEGFEADVMVTMVGDRIATVDPGVEPDDATRLEGITFPGMANAHSHVFHRLLRGHVGRGDFWSWRDAMYEVAAALDPDSYRQVAVAAFREMLSAGYTSVAEFHYLHHQPDGTPYDDPNVMADALADAAGEAGIRLTLLDTCYLSSGFGAPPQGAQLRFADGTAELWAERASAWSPPSGVKYGAAIHSVRAVDPDQMRLVVGWAQDRPLHVHLSEQPAENQASIDHLGRTPTQVLADSGVLTAGTTVVHATHITEADITTLGEHGVSAAICPTTERWLADGIGPTDQLAAAGISLGVGSDSQAVIDPFEEMRLLELHQRLATGRIGAHTPAAMLAAGTGCGRLVTGAPADLVTVSMETPRTAGVASDGLVFAATGADVGSVIVGGLRIR